MKHRCLIVDDEPLAIEIIESYLGKIGGFEVAGRCSDAGSALAALKSGPVDLMFLDIEMPGVKGTELLRALSDPPAVIFTTAHREFALEGYDLNVLDYLLKPVSLERFMKAVDRYLSSRAGKAGGVAGAFVNVRSDRKTVRLPVEEILYIEGMKDYINIVTTGGEVSTNMTLQSILGDLPPGRFIRIHRSYIVAAGRVTAFDSETVELGKKQLPVGRHYRAAVTEALGG